MIEVAGMGKIKDKNFVTIQGWMVTDLGLKGNELLIYAIIYGFTQEENQWFIGSRQYLSDWTGATRQTVSNYLKSLVEKNYIEKKERFVNGVKFCDYRVKNSPRVGENFTQGGIKNHPGVGEKFTTINNNTYLKDNDIDNQNNGELVDVGHEPTKKEIDEFFEYLWSEYPKKLGKGSVSDAQKKVLYDIGLSEMTRCLERYKKSIKGQDMQYVKYGSSFFNKGYIDYLDKNYVPIQTKSENDAELFNDFINDMKAMEGTRI